MDSIKKKLMATFQAHFMRVDWKCVRTVLFSFLLTRFIIVVIIFFSMKMIPANPGWAYNPRNLILNGLIRWDSPWYIDIAQNGYRLDSPMNTTAWFPFYPLLIRLASLFNGNISTSGVYVSNIFFLVALFYLYAFTKQEFDEDTAGRTVFYLASAPTAFFFSAVYTESTFLLLLAICFYYSRKQKWWLVAIAGALASATRPQGFLVAVFIFLEALWHQGIRFLPKPWNLKSQIALLNDGLKKIPKAWKGILASVFSLTGIAAYMIYLNQQFGDPLKFVHVMDNWNKTVSFDWPIKLIQNIQVMHRIGVPPYPYTISNFWFLRGEIDTFWYLIDTLTVFIFLPLIILVFLKFRPSIGWFSLLTFLMPLTTANTMSMQRYVVVIIPCFFLLALWGKRPWVDRLIMGVSLPLQSYFLVLFSHRFWAG
jgi:hypothetical protein